MSEIGEQKDIIQELQDRLLQSFIARNILQLLDVESLANAEQVSLCWKDVIVSGKLWEKLLRRKVHSDPEWKRLNDIIILGRKFPNTPPKSVTSREDEHLWYRKRCHLLHNYIQCLDVNWKTGRTNDEQFSTLPVEQVQCYCYEEDFCPFQMDELRIIQWHPNELTDRLDGSFRILNRWTLEKQNSTVIVPYAYSCHRFSNDVLVACRYGNGELHVWDLNSKDKPIPMLRCFNDSLKLRRSVNGHVDDGVPTSWKFDTERLRLCPKGRYLASILGGKSRNITDRFLLTLREFTAGVKQVTIRHQVLLDDNVERVRNLYVDDVYVLYRFRIKQVTGSVVQVRSTESFLLLHTIPIGGRVKDDFHYLDGLFLSEHSTISQLKVWDVESGKNVGAIAGFPSKFSTFRLIDNRFIITYSKDDGRLRTWDLKKILLDGSAGRSDMSSLLWTLPVRKSCEFNALVTDEYQVYAFGQYRSKQGHYHGFILALDLLDNLRAASKKHRLRRMYSHYCGGYFITVAYIKRQINRALTSRWACWTS